MKKPTVNQKVDMLSRDTKEQIRSRIGLGDSINSICERLKLEYAVVQTFCWREGILPWRGAKSYITRRLKKFKKATKEATREQLAREIGEQVDYIYYAAKELAAQKEKAKKSLGPGD